MPDTSHPDAPAEVLRRAGQHVREHTVIEDQRRHLGDLLMALGDEMADYPAVLVPNGVGIESQPNKPSQVWTAAYRFATAYLVEVMREAMAGGPS